MADNKKQERDFTVEVDALLPDAESLVKVKFSLHTQDTPVDHCHWSQSGKLQDALDKIFVLEKQTRNVCSFLLVMVNTELTILS